MVNMVPKQVTKRLCRQPVTLALMPEPIILPGCTSRWPLPVTSAAITAAGNMTALDRFLPARERIPNLRVIGIAGPGDALANFPATARSIELIRKADPSVIFCLSTNGLMLPFYSTELLRLGVTYVTVTINAVAAAIGAQIYSRIN